MTYFPRIHKRLQAMLIDGVAIGLCLFIPVYFIVTFDIENSIVKSFLLFFLVLTLEPFMVSFTGGSVGHHFAGIKVVDQRTQQHINLIRSYCRFLVKLVLGVYSLLSILFTQRYQAVHDIAAHSVVLFKAPERATPAQRLSERANNSDQGRASPTQIFFVTLAYCFIVFLGFAFTLQALLSEDCATQQICSASDVNTSNYLALLFLALGLLTIIASASRWLPGTK